jgi:LmbE family N-acetylglucosaminyl deacetylase
MMQTVLESWKEPQRILVILAHPDDPEFFCGATLARWTDAGHSVVYWLLTCGDKGANDPDTIPGELCGDRRVEQANAAAVLGVHQVNFMENPDGLLTADLPLRKEVTRIIRRERPDILVTCDPKTLYVGDFRINHPDHRAAGQVVLDAVFPAAGNPMYYPELMRVEGLMPHTPREVWICGTLDPNFTHDVTDLWERKIRAIQEHASQIGEPEALAERMRSRHTTDSTLENPRYEEVFRRIVFG